MNEVYDLMGSVLSSKADERMIGFAGFVRSASSRGQNLEGIVKVAAEHREDGSGYLTLTFIIDREPDASPEKARTRLGQIDSEALRKRLGPEFEMLIQIPLSEFSASAPFDVEEMDVYFRHLQGHEKRLVETGLFPAFEDLLGLRFEGLQAWRAEKASQAGRLLAEAEARIEAAPERRSLFKRLFGGA